MKKNLFLLAYTLLSCSVFAQISSYVPQNGLVLYLPFNNSYQDLSTTNATVTPFGGGFAADQFGNANSVYKCTQAENLEIATNGSSPLKPSGDFSISLWVNYDGVVLPFNKINYATFVECGSGSSYYLRYFERPIGSPIHVDVQAGYLNGLDNGGSYSSTTHRIKDQFQSYPGWTHITYTVTTSPFAGVGVHKLYVNGVLAISTESSSTPVYGTNDVVSIGGIRGNTLSDIKRFAGSLDDIAMYNRALTAQEVAQLYSGYINENRNKEAYLSFNGSSNYVEINTPLNLNSNNVIIEAQVYFDATTNANDGIVVSRDGNTIAGIIVQNIVNQGTGVRLGYMWNGLHYDWTGGPVVSFNEWHSVRLIITPTSAYIYANSTFARNEATHAIEEFDGKLLLGADSYGERKFNGKLDEVRIWKNFDMNVLNRVVNGTGGVCPVNVTENPQLVAYYTFNQADEITPTTAPSILKDKLGLRNGNLIGYATQPVGSWFFGGPIIDIDAKLSLDPLDATKLIVNEKKATQYDWYKNPTSPALYGTGTQPTFTASEAGSYYVTITKGSCTMNSNAINITITNLNADLDTNNKIQFYPNPSSGFVQLNTEVESISIYNNQGILQLETSGKNLNLNNLSKGNYILKIKNKNESSTQKLILE